MNVIYIFVFTISVVLPKRLNIPTFDYTSEESKPPSRQSVKKLFMEPTRQESAVYADEEGNIFIRAYVQTKSPRQAIFFPRNVPDMPEKRVGIYVLASRSHEKANKELIEYVMKIFDIPRSSIRVLCGSRSKQKILKLTHGYITVEESINKIIDCYLETNNE